MGWSGPMTSRQYWAWLDWIEDDMDRPSRTDWYLMELTEVLRCHALKDWEHYDASKRKIRFLHRGEERRKPVRDPKTGIMDPYADETDEERAERYRKQQITLRDAMVRSPDQDRDEEW